MKSRSRSILAKLISLLALPLLSLIVLWGIAAGLTLSDGLLLLKVNNQSNAVVLPAQDLAAELRVERQQSMVTLAPNPTNSAQLAAQRKRTDSAVKTFRRKALGEIKSGVVRQQVDSLLTSLDKLPAQRRAIDDHVTSRLAAFDYYTDVIARAFRAVRAVPNIPDSGLAIQAEMSIQLSSALEVQSQEVAILSGALADGRFQNDEYARFVGLVRTQRYIYANAVPQLPRADQDDYQAFADSPAARTVTDMENAVAQRGTPKGEPPVAEAAWNSNTQQLISLGNAMVTRSANRLIDALTPAAVWIILRLAVAGFLGLIAVVASVIISVRIGRSLVRELVGVRRSALSLATQELPAVVRRLRAGEKVDVAAEVQPLTGFTIREVAGVAEAMDAARSTAVEVAIEEAQLRQGVREVFLNLARRSQTLVHRQLTLLDQMERREKDPEELDDLFQLDHLATRMRRHAEDLIVLSGSTPGRGWRNPVPLVDVMRGAVAEVEDYARVRVVGATRASLAGRGVSDVIHLLAELIENATAFSPPHTTVHVSGELVPAGFAIEIEDRGLGMPPEQLAELNTRLAEPPEFDLLHSERLGLFVVGQLARRHDIRVVLRGSPFGGTTAIVLLPTPMVIAPEASSITGRSAAQRSAQQDEPQPTEPRPIESSAAPRTLTIAPDLPAEPELEPDEAPDTLPAADPFPVGEASPTADVFPAAASSPVEAPEAAAPPSLPARIPSQYSPYRPATHSLRAAEQHRADEAAREAQRTLEATRSLEAAAARSTAPGQSAPEPEQPESESESFTDFLTEAEPEPLSESPADATTEPAGEAATSEEAAEPLNGFPEPTPAPAIPAFPAPVTWPTPEPGGWPTQQSSDQVGVEPASALPESPTPVPPLARREPGLGWEQLSSSGSEPPVAAADRQQPFVGESPEGRPRGVARAPLASRGVPEEAPAGQLPPVDQGPHSEATPIAGGVTTGGLPRRVRQASLAAPLRSGPPASINSPEPTTTRSPEEIRGLMSSYQRGSVLGRTDAARTIDRSGTGPSSLDGRPAASESGHDGEFSNHEELRNNEVTAGHGAPDGTREGER